MSYTGVVEQYINEISWFAVALLCSSYWFQIWKIYVHKEARDLSLTYHVLLAIGFGILAFTAYVEGSVIFLAKQVLTTIPVLIIIAQILYYKDDWHSSEDLSCNGCSKFLESNWVICPYCGDSSHSKLITAEKKGA